MRTSVVIALYNGQSFIVDQLNSIIEQTKKVDEIIIVNDASTDNSLNLISNYIDSHSNIKLIENHNNLGVLKTFEKGLSLASGDYVFLADQDDVWFKNKVEVYSNYFINFPEKKLFYSDGLIVDKELNVTGSLGNHFYKNNTKSSSERIICSLRMSNFIPGAVMAITNDLIRELLPFPKGDYLLHDGWIAVYSHLMEFSYFIPQELIYYRRHDMTYTNIQDYSSLLKKFSRTLNYSELILYYDNISSSFNAIVHLLNDSNLKEVELFASYYKCLQSKIRNNASESCHNFTILNLIYYLAVHFSFIFLFKTLLFEIYWFFKRNR
jgi:glycosyltransferase involved in cell wall biosynthesis